MTRAGDDSPIGVLAYRAGASEAGWLSFEAVSVEPGLRGMGLESEAVRLVEGEALNWGACRFRATVPHGDGLGVYFWLRLGYRPEVKPGGQRDKMSMIRDAVS